MNHWARDYIGLPWHPTGDCKKSFNCWTFVRHIQSTYYGRDLPDLCVNAENAHEVAKACAIESTKRPWIAVDIPQDGDTVLLCRVKYPLHVGIWINANGTEGVLHCVRGMGVVFQTKPNLRLSGWGNLSYYRWANES